MAVAVLAGLGVSMAWAQTNSIDGLWRTQDGERIIEIAPCARETEERCGAIVWLNTPTDGEGRPLRDGKNPEAARQRRALCEMVILTGLKLDGLRGTWVGTIYEPDDGVTSQGGAKREEDRLRVMWSIAPPGGVPSNSALWSRVNKPFARCSPM